MEIIWTDRVKNELLRRLKWERHFVHTVKGWTGHILLSNCRLKLVIEGKMEGRREVAGRQGRTREQLLYGCIVLMELCTCRKTENGMNE
jgi:hypothetical protein